MNKYNVVKDYECLCKGDVIKEQEDGSYVVEYTNNKVQGVNYSCKIKMNQNYLDTLIKNGVAELIQFKSTTKYDSNYKILKENYDKLNTKYVDYVRFLNDMRNAYEQDKMNAIEAYTDGDLAVNEYKQSVTVYENLLKFIDVSLKKLA